MQTGTVDEPGYRTVPLQAAVPLQQGECFSVVVKLTAPGVTKPVAIEYPIAGYSSKASANPGESYVSSDGETWQDLTTRNGLDEANVCLKAFTTLTAVPVANFTANVTSGTAPLAVQFTDTSTGSPTTWAWDFGDTTTSTEQHPVHTYTAAGTYSVNLTVTNAGGSDSLVKADSITVTAAAPLVTDPAATPAVIPTDTDGTPGAGETTVLSVAVAGANIASVTVNLSAIGGSSVTPMTDAGDGTWTMNATATLSSRFEDGVYLPVLLAVNATDADGLSNTSVSIPLTVVKNGDANEDNRVTLYDAVYTARHLLKSEGYPMTESVGLVSGGDALSLADAMYLAKHLLGIPGFEQAPLTLRRVSRQSSPLFSDRHRVDWTIPRPGEGDATYIPTISHGVSGESPLTFIVRSSTPFISHETNPYSMTEGLLLVDIQNDYFPGGAKELAGMEPAAMNAARLLSAFRESGRPVIFVRHISARPGAAFFLPGTRGAEIHGRVSPLPREPVVEKSRPNSFLDTDLSATLAAQGVTVLVICGAMSHMCIDATTRAARDLGYSCTVIADGCAASDLTFGGVVVPAGTVHAAFMAALDGTYARVTTTGEYLRLLTR